MNEPLTVYTTAFCGDCVATKRALDARGIAYDEVALESDPDAVARVEAMNDGRRSVPTLVRGTVAASLSRCGSRRPEACGPPW